MNIYEYEYIYLYGGPFTLYTNFKPMELILKNPKSKPSARIEPWNLRLQDYQFNVLYTNGQYNPSDFLSRHPISDQTSLSDNPAEDYGSFLSSHAVPKAMNLSEIQEATRQDPTLQYLITLLRNNTRLDFLKLNSAVSLPDNVSK